ncbi:MAG: hypothetical protein RL702_2221 [Pseudomonadota bacterium]
MSRLATSFVLGYHGCDAAVARKAVLDGAEILQSEKDYDWLGPGAYFWESDPTRAWEWARWKADKGDYSEPAVIGAVIDLRNCLDLVSREDIELFRAAHNSFKRLQKLSGLPMPKNVNPKGSRDKDRLLRFLDCAVFRHLHRIIDEIVADDASFEPYDTVRGMFVEGGKAFPGSGVYRKSHIQIAVRNGACIKGIFYPANSK